LTRLTPSTNCQKFNVSYNVRRIQRLTPLKIAALKKAGRHSDGRASSCRSARPAWLFRYTMHGREHRMGLGSLNDFSLAEARERARVARQLLADGKDPLLAKRQPGSRP
jgi:Arm DNA-binding domain